METEKLVALAMILAVIASCTTSNTGEGGSSETGEKFRTGTQGLTLAFVPGVPPDKVFSDSEVSVIFEIKNKGAADVENAILYMTGYDKKYLFGTDQQQAQFSLVGKSPMNPDGELMEAVEFNTVVSDLPEGIDKFTQTVKGTLCYSYETLASPSICINPAIHTGQVSDSICQVRPVSLGGGQGAPVSVDKVEQEMIGEQIVFKVYISNKGRGVAYIKPINDCHRTLKFNEINLVNVDHIGFSDFDLTDSCNPSPVRLVNNNGYFICAFRADGGFGPSSYTTPLNIKLSYNYRESIKKDFQVVKI